MNKFCWATIQTFVEIEGPDKTSRQYGYEELAQLMRQAYEELVNTHAKCKREQHEPNNPPGYHKCMECAHLFTVKFTKLFDFDYVPVTVACVLSQYDKATFDFYCCGCIERLLHSIACNSM